jgi:steroid delta-isomerase
MTRSALWVAFLLAAVPAAAQDTPESAIRARLEAWTADFNAGRWDRLCDLFARDLVADFPGVPQKTWRSQCDMLLALGASDRRYRYGLTIHEIIPTGDDYAIVRLTWALEVSGPGLDGTVATREPGMDLFRREADGAWRIARYLAYEAPPDPS